jgi:hypothetical protein
MTLRRAPLPAYSRKSVEGQAYSALWAEIADRIGMSRRPGAEQQPSGKVFVEELDS